MCGSFRFQPFSPLPVFQAKKNLMKIRLILLFLCLSFYWGVSAQTKVTASAGVSKTSSSKTTTTKKTSAKTSTKGKKSSKSKKLKTAGEMEFEEVICYEDGPCTFTILKKDTLVYEVNAAGKQFNLLVVPNKFDAATIADFNWKIIGAETRSGHVVINAKALSTGKKYMVNLPAGELKLSDASSFWLSNANFKEIAKGETSITMDNGQAESFKSPEADAVTTDINYKGKPLVLEGFALQNKAEGEPGRKEMWVLNVSNNLLIIKLDNGEMSMQLKEVRERK
jgi:hypothetical protein